MSTAELVATIIAAVGAFGGAFTKLVVWVVKQWRAERAIERDERRGDRETVVDIQLTLAAMLERDRVLYARAKRSSEGAAPRPRPRQDFDEEEVSNVVEIKNRLRSEHEARTKKTPPLGVRAPRPGTHHDED